MLPKSMAYVLVVLSIFIVSAAQILIKWRFEVLGFGQREGRGIVDSILLLMSDPRLWLAAGLILIGAASWYAALSRLPLSFLIPVGSVIAPMTAIGACLFLGESLSLSQMGAIATIALGVTWLGLSQG